MDGAWKNALERVASAKVAILGIPSDCGAGLIRGAAFGPQALRPALLASGPLGEGVVDVGDVVVVPHLLHDEMVNERQKAACRTALGLPIGFPVSPLSIAERVIDQLFILNPTLKLLVIGGDHSTAWPVVAALDRHLNEPWAIVQPDAHTDLLPERLGVKYCFATWAYHANELLGRGGRLVQVGIRASRHDRAHWERTTGVKQIWADEVRTRGEAAVIEEIVGHLRSLGIKAVYFSNDIDATDAALAPSTGAAESGGLSEGFIRALVAQLGQSFRLVAADLMEVAPPIGSPEDSRRTVAVGASYLRASLEALLA